MGKFALKNKKKTEKNSQNHENIIEVSENRH